MRQIKFRGKEKGTGKWVYGFYFKSSSKHIIAVYNPHANHIDFNEDDVDWYEVEEKSVGQFTGLLDENKVEIYEGDVYKSYSRNVDSFIQIIFEDGQFRGQYDNSNFKYSLNSDETKELEKVGNIYENPELLEKK